MAPLWRIYPYSDNVRHTHTQPTRIWRGSHLREDHCYTALTVISIVYSHRCIDQKLSQTQRQRNREDLVKEG